MHLRTELLQEHSKAQAEKIAAWIGTNTERFAVLMHLFLHDEYRIVQRSAWVVSIIAEQHPALLIPYMDIVMEKLTGPATPDAVKRNVVRLLQYVLIPEELHGKVMDLCFGFLADPAEAIAVRCFSMTVLANLAQTYPEIKQELQTVIEECLEQHPSAGFIARAKKTMKHIRK